MPKFRKKPIVIEAELWNGTGNQPPYRIKTMDDSITQCPLDHNHVKYFLATREGWQTLTVGDWIITGIQGEPYPCKPDIFALTYEAVEEA